MRNRLFGTLLLCAGVLPVIAQVATKPEGQAAVKSAGHGVVKSAGQGVARPKLVVGIVVDQMRWDYLYRYMARYGTGGFRRLLDEGFSCEDVYISHLPSYTAVGHTTIFSGSVPSVHGIAGNDWIDQATGKDVYCVGDSAVQPVGGTS